MSKPRLEQRERKEQAGLLPCHMNMQALEKLSPQDRWCADFSLHVATEDRETQDVPKKLKIFHKFFTGTIQRSTHKKLGFLVS